VPEIRELRSLQSIPVYSDLRLPDGRARAPLLVGLHGYGGEKAGMMRALVRLGGNDFALASVQGPFPHIAGPRDPGRRLGYGFGWITSFRPEDAIAVHHAALDDLIGGLVREGRADPAAVFLFGFSQSVAINFRYVFTSRRRLRGVVGVCGGIPGDWESEGKYETSDVDILYLGGSRDEFYPAERIRENGRALARRAAAVETEILDVGHEITPAVLDRVRDWLAARI
jgi:predicted esterase